MVEGILTLWIGMMFMVQRLFSRFLWRIAFTKNNFGGKMSKETALLVVHARMLNCSWRRIAELFGDNDRQDTGRRLLHEAERTLGFNIL